MSIRDIVTFIVINIIFWYSYNNIKLAKLLLTIILIENNKTYKIKYLYYIGLYIGILLCILIDF